MPLKVSDGIGAWIKDFKKSDAPQFKGKSAKERQAQAVAAYLSAKRGPLKKENVKSADKKPEIYTKPDGKRGVRMVPTDKDVIKKEAKSFGVRRLPMGKRNPDNPVKRKAQSLLKTIPPSKPLKDLVKMDELKYTTMNKYMSKAQRSMDTAKRSHDANILRGTDPSKDKATVSKRAKGMKLAKSRAVDKIRKGMKEDMTFKVDIEGLPALFISGNSPGQVKNHLRKLIKQPSMIKSVDRQTKHDVKKMYRKKAQGKGLDEDSPVAVNELSPDMMKAYKKAASDSNYKAASKYARIAQSPTGKKYKDKEMAKQDNIMRKRKAGLARADKRESAELDERTPIRPTVKDKKLKNLRVPNPNYKGSLDRKPKQKRAMHSEDAMSMVRDNDAKSKKGYKTEKMTLAKIRSKLYKTAKVMGDVQAVRKKKVGKRIARRVAGKVTGRALSKLFNHNEGTDAPKGPESYEAQYKRRLVKTTDPEHKAKGYKYRIKGKKDSSLTKKLYKSKPNQAEFNRQMRRIAGHEFG